MSSQRARWAILGGPLFAAAVAATLGGLFDGVALLDPAAAATVEGLAWLALIGSWLRRDRRWLRVTLPALLLLVAVSTGALALMLRVTGTVTDPYPVTFALWVSAAFAAGAGLPLLRGTGWVRRAAAVAAVPLSLAGGLMLIDQEYGVWPHVGDLLGHEPLTSRVALKQALRRPPTKGELLPFDPPSTVSHFQHRPGVVYLPPAYFTAARASLPVLVMLAGAPGTPTHWSTAGRAVATTDAYAEAHHGFAPVLVLVDQNGSATGDTECVDGPRGNAETFLTVDVPAAVTGTLQIPIVAERWGIVGFSEGGTCALDLVLGHPDVYRHLVDLGGDAGPNLGDPHHTLATLFGGSALDRQDHDPAYLLATRHYTGVTAWFAAGEADRGKISVARRLAPAAARAGIVEHEFTGAGGHNWQFASSAYERILPQLAVELGIP